MKNFILTLAIALTLATNAYAIPTLQLDIAGGTYNNATETIVAANNRFTLYVYLIEDAKNELADKYFVSAALIPKHVQATPKPDFGSFDYITASTVTTIKVTEEMLLYGFPPIEANIAKDPGDLPKHDIFPTYFTEFGFKFSQNDTISQYNTQERARTGGSIPGNGTGMYFKSFTFDLSGLDYGYGIHFDLYNETNKAKEGSNDIDVSAFAQFSHDAEGWRHNSPAPVPEPGTMVLLGFGMLGLAIYSKRRINKDT